MLAHDDRGAAILKWARGQVASVGGDRGGARVLTLIAQLMFGKPALYGIPSALPFLRLGETVYQPPQAPRQAAVASLAVLNLLMGDADRELMVRTYNARRLLRSLTRSAHLGGAASVPGGEPGYLRLPLLVRKGERRALLTTKTGRLGITPGYSSTLTALPSLAHRVVGTKRGLPGSNTLAESLVTLPTHGLLTESDLSALEDWMVADFPGVGSGS